MIKKFPLLIFFLIGILFRLWFIRLFPQPFAFDQERYHWFAKEILYQGLYVDSFRSYGYPLILAIIYQLFGIDASLVRVIQAGLDAVVALFLFCLARKLFKSNKPAYVVLLLYLFNPFTSGFIGVLMTEVITTFLIALVFIALLYYLEKKNSVILVLLTFSLGYLPQVRPAFILFSLVFLSALFFIIIKDLHLRLKKILLATSLGLLFFFLPFLYTLVGNWMSFRQLSLTTVDNMFVQNFYISLFVEKVQFRSGSIWFFPPQVVQLWNEFSIPKTTQRERDEMADKYWRLAINEIKNDPVRISRWYMAKLWYVWEKHFLFWITGPDDKIINLVVCWGNRIILLFSILGLCFFQREIGKSKERKSQWFLRLTIFLFIYISVIYTMSTTEERYSLPAYPLVFLFCGYGIWQFYSKMRSVIFRKRSVNYLR